VLAHDLVGRGSALQALVQGHGGLLDGVEALQSIWDDSVGCSFFNLVVERQMAFSTIKSAVDSDRLRGRVTTGVARVGVPHHDLVAPSLLQVVVDRQVGLAVRRANESGDDAENFVKSVLDELHLFVDLSQSEAGGEVHMRPGVREVQVAQGMGASKALYICGVIDAAPVQSIDEEVGSLVRSGELLGDVFVPLVRAVIEGEGDLAIDAVPNAGTMTVDPRRSGVSCRASANEVGRVAPDVEIVVEEEGVVARVASLEVCAHGGRELGEGGLAIDDGALGGGHLMALVEVVLGRCGQEDKGEQRDAVADGGEEHGGLGVVKQSRAWTRREAGKVEVEREAEAGRKDRREEGMIGG